MKTSPSQFEMLVNFIEQHGDINKLNKNARGRIQTIQDWERLTNLLNSDPTGETKNTEKWKKVWSDLKNNTKKKAARINRAACGTGGGPALNLQLTDLEQRVLNIILPQAATGLTGVREAGFSENQTDSLNRTVTLSPTPPVPAASHEIIEESEVVEQSQVVEESPVINIRDFDAWTEAGPSHITSPLPQPSPTTNTYHEVEVVLDSPPPASPLRPTHAGHTPQRRRRGITSRRTISPRRRVIRQPNQIERATEQFLNCDEQWRAFLRKKYEDDLNLERERLRIRELELETQKKWQDVALLAVEAIHKNSKSYYFEASAWFELVVSYGEEPARNSMVGYSFKNE